MELKQLSGQKRDSVSMKMISEKCVLPSHNL